MASFADDLEIRLPSARAREEAISFELKLPLEASAFQSRRIFEFGEEEFVQSGRKLNRALE